MLIRRIIAKKWPIHVIKPFHELDSYRVNGQTMVGILYTFFWIQTIDKIILDINKKEEIKDLSQNQQNSKFT